MPRAMLSFCSDISVVAESNWLAQLSWLGRAWVRSWSLLQSLVSQGLTVTMLRRNKRNTLWSWIDHSYKFTRELMPKTQIPLFLYSGSSKRLSQGTQLPFWRAEAVCDSSKWDLCNNLHYECTAFYSTNWSDPHGSRNWTTCDLHGGVRLSIKTLWNKRGTTALNDLVLVRNWS